MATRQDPQQDGMTLQGTGPQETTLQALADLVGGQLLGGGELPIRGAATLRHAQPGEITLAANPHLAARLAQSAASAAVVPAGFPAVAERALLVVADVHAAFSRIVAHFRPPREVQWPRNGCPHIDPSARLGPDVQVHPTASIGADVVIGAGSRIHAGVRILDGCQLGDRVTLFPNVVLYENTRIGSGATLHAGVVIGAYGFGYNTVDGRHVRGAQLGHVEIGADVEIGANTTIDRGTYDATVIGEGTKIDNQVQIGHNCRLGRHNVICSQVGIAGSCTTGDYVVMAGQVGLSDHLDIGSGATLGAKSGVMQNVAAGETVIGSPAMPERDFWRMWVHVQRLPQAQKQLKQWQRELADLQQRLAGDPSDSQRGEAA